EARGHGWLQATHPEDKERTGEIFRQANAGRAPFHAEYRLRRADGSYSWAIDTAQPRFAPDGTYLGYVGAVIDISGRKAAEDSLRASESRFRTLTDTIPAFVWFADWDGAVTYHNARWYAYSGLTEAESVGPGWLRTLHPDDLAQTAAAWEEARARSMSYVVECRYRRLDGAYRWFVARAEPLRDEAGRITGWFGTSTDIDDRKRAEEAYLETTRRLNAVLNNASVAILMMDERQQCVFMNPAAEQLTGYTLPETQGRPLHDVVHHTHPDGRPFPLSECPIDQAFPENNQERGETVFVHKDGRFYPVAFTASPIRDDFGQPIGTVIEVRDITEEKGAAEALLQSEQRFRDIADSIDQMIWSTQPDGFHDYFNRRWYQFTGAPEGSTDGEGWVGMFHPEDQPQAQALWARCLETGEPYRVEYRLRRHDGQWRWVLGRALPVRDAEGRITRWYGTCTDIHDQKMVEARLNSIMDALPVGVLLAEAPAGRVVQANRYMETLLRRPVRTGNDTASYSAREAYTAEGHRIEPDEWPVRRVLATGAPAEAEVRFRRGDNSFGWLRIQAAPLRDATGDTVGAVAGVTDLDEIVAARDVLARSRAELEQRAQQLAAERDRMWRVSRELMLVAGSNGRIDAVNPAWTDQLGWASAELIGRSFLDLVHPDDVESTSAEASALGAGRPTPRFENRYRTKDGDYKWLSWTAVPEAGRIFATARDVDAEKRQAEALERVQDQLRQAQKMEAVGQLTGGVAHDFNNLLQIVVGNLELLGRSLPAEAARQRRSVDNAMSGAKRAVTLTQRLLAFSRRQPLDPKPVSVNRLVAGMSELLSRALGETIELETVLAAGLWKVEVDPNQLENAILNLAVNARDAMPDGGKLTLETANTRLDESYVQQNVEVTPGHYVVICVSDTGVGMDREVAARVFEPFFTTKEVGKGTGLGLSQVYGFVKQSGGHVKIYSERGSKENRGTTVKIYLPRYLGSGEEEAQADELPAPEGGPEETILVVEDDPDVRAYTVEVLSELGYRVMEAGDARLALTLLRDGATHCDLLFTDVVLPGGVNGEQLAAEAHVARPGLKVLFTTGYARNAILHQGRLGPGVRLITKPFTYAELAARIRDVLDEPAAPLEHA
ncbi:MAG: PAS domain S-box protein, partial [Proteobacteria bacterium]|nr:PAS domain S-box protein [Pseudomonadota bacterium]